MDHSPVKITETVIEGSTERAPMAKLLTLIRTCGIGLAATKPSFLDLVGIRGHDAVQVLAHADIAEIRPGVSSDAWSCPTGRRNGGTRPSGISWPCEACRGRNSRSWWGNTRDAPSSWIMLCMVFSQSSVSGDALFFRDLDAGHRLDGGSALGMGLVVSVIVLRTDIDEADRDGLCGRLGWQGRACFPPRLRQRRCLGRHAAGSGSSGQTFVDLPSRYDRGNAIDVPYLARHRNKGPLDGRFK